jgi:hypothetical protein
MCKPLTGAWQTQCHSSDSSANSWCYGISGNYAYLPNCLVAHDETGDADGGHGGAPWDPSSHITYNPRENIYEIEAAFANALKIDMSLLANDRARLRESHLEGYYELVDVSQGDLAHAMGLQTRDLLFGVNGYDLGTLDGQMDAYVGLQEEFEFTLEIIRGPSAMTLEYIIVE